MYHDAPCQGLSLLGLDHDPGEGLREQKMVPLVVGAAPAAAAAAAGAGNPFCKTLGVGEVGWLAHTASTVVLQPRTFPQPRTRLPPSPKNDDDIIHAAVHERAGVRRESGNGWGAS